MRYLAACFLVGFMLLGLQGCFPIVAGGVVAGALIVEDRRTKGALVEDQEIEFTALSRINLKYRRYLAAFLTLADLDAQLAFRQHGLVPGALKYSNVEKCVARAVAQLNKAEALLRIEPFDGCVDGWARRGRIRARCTLK